MGFSGFHKYYEHHQAATQVLSHQVSQQQQQQKQADNIIISENDHISHTVTVSSYNIPTSKHKYCVKKVEIHHFKSGMQQAAKKRQNYTMNEMNLLHLMHHRNIVSTRLIAPMFDNEQALLHQAYMVFKTMDGTIDELFNKQLSYVEYTAAHGEDKFWLEVLFVLLEVIRGLNYLHNQCNIIHRDIKPKNICYDWDATHNRVKRICIIDFDIAKMPLKSVEINLEHTMIGARGYMSKQQLTSVIPPQHEHPEKDEIYARYNSSADVYAFAVTVAECLKWQMKTVYVDNNLNTSWKLLAENLEEQPLNKKYNTPVLNPNNPHVVQLYELMASCTREDSAQRPNVEQLEHKLLNIMKDIQKSIVKAAKK